MRVLGFVAAYTVNPVRSFISTSCNVLHVFAAEAFATITRTLPNAIKWVYLTRVSKKIVSFRVTDTTQKTKRVATLSLYNSESLRKQNISDAVLLGHGDFSHPYTMLHFAKTVEEELKCPVFLLNLPNDLNYEEPNQLLVDSTLTKIQDVVGKHETFKGITLVGHSMAGIWSAHQAFAKNDPRINKVVTIAGRFRVTPTTTILNGCDEGLKPVVNAIDEGIKSGQSKTPHHMIVAEKDWCTPREATNVAFTTKNIVPNAYHLNILYKKETYQHLREALRA
jgi:hypothetical protein